MQMHMYVCISRLCSTLVLEITKSVQSKYMGGRCIVMILPSGVVTLRTPRICGNCSTSTAKQFENQEEEEKGTGGVSGVAST